MFSARMQFLPPNAGSLSHTGCANRWFPGCWSREVWLALFCGAVLLAMAPRSLVLADEEKATPPDAREKEYYELMKLFVDSFEQVERNYVKPVDRKQLLESALRGMLADLDPYSSYIDSSGLAEFTQQVEQEFGGIGIQVSLDPKTRQLVVMTPLPGTPAYKAGIRAGDRILSIAGKPTAEFADGKELESAVVLMKGKPGEIVKLSVLHETESTPVELDVERAIIRTPSVLGDKYNEDGSWSFYLDGLDKVAYVRLSQFGRNSADEIKSTLKELEQQGMKGLILDLRYNPGGLLTAATEIADMFLDSGVIVSTRGRNTEEQVFKAKKSGTFRDFPVVVLVNRFSASASEILSAALQDHDRAIIVGERSWGKGSVQNVINVDGGKSALKLTTASYHRPSGKNIHRFPNSKETDEWGVKPTEGYEVKMTPEQMQKYLEYRRQRDVLRKEAGASSFDDPQLAKAVEYLKSKISPASEAKPEDGKEKAKGETSPPGTAPQGDSASKENSAR
ncbi:S41 family peptidase [Planctopirus hydrillae]|uniref:Peptidase S41 n=1 Tax=Planctopirus hydrillae TaxID=1841610 RepID=A0A1C3EQP6_9PLAN|nr:S41 family peptidase [Planctopirus hydrillae]ODA35512.1 peptidase S41 [Planctopirus hydrillae]